VDVFWVGEDGQVWSQWWDETPNNSWANHAVFAIRSRSLGHLDKTDRFAGNFT
jgi:hypothetical protein